MHRLKFDPSGFPEKYDANCPCPKQKCELWGYCQSCEFYHERKNQMPFCKREIKPNKSGGKLK